MRFIHAWAYSCANLLMKAQSENHQKRAVYYYGFQALFGELTKVLLLIVISLLLGSLLPTMTAAFTFAALRNKAGGYHMKTYGKCFVLTLAMFIAAGLLTQHTYQLWALEYIMGFALVSLLAAVIVVCKWVPRETPNRPINKPEEIRRFKRQSYIFTGIWGVAAIVFTLFKLPLFVISSSLGLLLELFMIIPLGYSLLERIDGMAASVKKSQ